MTMVQALPRSGVASRRWRRLAPIVLAAVVAACSGASESGPSQPPGTGSTAVVTSSTSTPLPMGAGGALAEGALVAACLQGAGPPVLCTLDVASGTIEERQGVVVDSGTPLQISPDRRRVALIRDGELVIHDLAADEAEHHPIALGSMRWLNDRELAYRIDDDPTLWRYELDGEGPPVALPDRCGGDALTAFDTAASLGRAVVVCVDDDERSRVELVATEDWRHVETIEIALEAVHQIAMAPTGDLLAVVSDDVLYLRSPGSGEVRISPLDALATTPAFSPDGEHLVHVDSRAAVMASDLSTGTLRAVVDLVDEESRPAGLPVFPDWGS